MYLRLYGHKYIQTDGGTFSVKLSSLLKIYKFYFPGLNLLFDAAVHLEERLLSVPNNGEENIRCRRDPNCDRLKSEGKGTINCFKYVYYRVSKIALFLHLS